MDGGVVLPQLMGVINVTPDSFSDGGRHLDPSLAVNAALQMASEGADWVDIGGESTRPGSSPVSIDEEIRRVIPVIEQIKQADPSIKISIDTSKAAVAETAIAAGATMVNDITALGDPYMADLCAAHDVKLVLMHMRGAPKTMQDDTQYDQLEDEVESNLVQRIELARSSGVSGQNIILDPGVGFGKALEDNPRVIAMTRRLNRLGYPVLIGASRKKFIGSLTGVQAAQDRVFGSIGAALAATAAGAAFLRVHDVPQTRRALQVFCTVNRYL